MQSTLSHRVRSSLVGFVVAWALLFGFTRAQAATLLVTNTNPAGAGSLRAVGDAAQDGDTIQFAANVVGTIEFGPGEFFLEKSIDIQGPGAHRLTVHTRGRFATVLSTCTLRISGLTLSGRNFVGDFDGCALYNEFGTLELRDCLITDYTLHAPDGSVNTNIDGSDARGGAILNSGTFTAINCTFLRNAAIGGNGTVAGTEMPGAGGNAVGGALCTTENATLVNCTFSGNTAVAGHGQSNGDETAFGGNSLGGAIAVSFGSLTLQSCTLVANEARGGRGVPDGQGIGGAIWKNDSASGTIRSTLVAGNRTFSSSGNSYVAISNADLRGNFNSGGFNLIGRGNGATGFNAATDLSGTDAAPLDPRVFPITNNGGTIPTVALQFQSPANDTGNSFGVTHDARQTARPIDLPLAPNAAGGDATDIGAYELDPADTDPGPTLTVNSLDDHDDGACTTTDCTLREAINLANTLPRVPSITFTSSVRGTLNLVLGPLMATHSMTIYGPGKNALTISGGNASRLFVANGDSIALRDLTFANGFSSGADEDSAGGAIVVEGGRLGVNDCAFVNNVQNLGAGGAIASRGQLQLYRCDFIGNRTTGGNFTLGGAVYVRGGITNIAYGHFADNSSQGTNGRGGAIGVRGGQVDLSDSFFTRNTALSGAAIASVNGIDGAGVPISGGVTLLRGNLRGNTATVFGGAITSEGSLTVQESLFTDNVVAGAGTRSDAAGGALYLTGPATINNSSFNTNAVRGTSAGGGAIFTRGAPVTVGLSRFVGNNATGMGGAIFNAFQSNESSVLRLNQCSFASGRAAQGGALYVEPSSSDTVRALLNGCSFGSNNATAGHGGAIFNGGVLDLSNSNVVGNKASSEGGGVYTSRVLTANHSTVARNAAANCGGIRNAAGTAQVRGSLIAGNGGGPRPDAVGAFISIGYNLIGKNAGSTGFGATGDKVGTAAQPLDPGLDAAGLKDNGGPTPTIALVAGSPAIDAAPAYGQPVDQRGVARPTDQPGVPNAAGGDGSDIGAFELLTTSVVPTITINDVVQREGDVGNGAATFTVRLSQAPQLPINVEFFTSDGTAVAGRDYTAISGIVSFAPGTKLTKTISVVLIGNNTFEGDRAFNVNLARPVNATIADNLGTATILENEPRPNLSISDAAVKEGNSGNTNAVFFVTMSGPSRFPVTVNYATFNGNAIAGTDYQSVSGTATIPAGQVRQTINVPIIGNTERQQNRLFGISLSNPTIATLADANGVGTIVDDDVPAGAAPGAAPAPAAVRAAAGAGAVSSATADSASQTITLRFSGAATVDAALYTVAVNGVDVPLQSIAERGADIVVGLAEGALKSGDQAKVTWRTAASDAEPAGSTTIKVQ